MSACFLEPIVTVLPHGLQLTICSIPKTLRKTSWTVSASNHVGGASRFKTTSEVNGEIATDKSELIVQKGNMRILENHIY
jgi:hypothetical protein